MEFRGKNILIISPEPWNHIFVSKHHYATHLAARGNKVYFLNPPTSEPSVEETKYNGLSVVNYQGFIRGMRFLPGFLQRYILRTKFEEIERLCKTSFDVVWSFDNSVFFDFTALPKRIRSICHIVDLNQNFQVRRAAETASICFCVSENIKQRLLQYNRLVFKIQHGYNVCQMQYPALKLPGENKLKAMYVGNLALKYIDWTCITETVIGNPDVDFVFIGPNKDRIQASNEEAAKLVGSNVYWLGKKSPYEVVQFLSASDILMVTYREDYQDQTSNTHKMMEYLGSGKVVVATFTEEYKLVNDLIVMVNRNEIYPFAFRKVVDNLSFFNNEENVAKRISFALDNTYDKQLERIEQILSRF